MVNESRNIFGDEMLRSVVVDNERRHTRLMTDSLDARWVLQDLQPKILSEFR